MRVLAWDTSSRIGAVAAVETDERGGLKLVAEWTLGVENTRHSERLLWGIHHTIESAGWRLADVDAFGVGAGPGSFTGLRVGITTARTLATQTGRPLVGISSLAAVARPAADWLTAAGRGRTVLAVVREAFQSEVFALWGPAQAVAKSNCEKLWAKGVHEDALAPAELAKRIRSKGAVVFGDGAGLMPRAGVSRGVGAFSGQVQGRYVALLAVEAIHAGLGRADADVRPRYLRDSSAEMKLRAGLLRPPGTRRS